MIAAVGQEATISKRRRRRSCYLRCYPDWILRLPRSEDFQLVLEIFIGAGEGARTLDPDLGKVVLYH